MRSVPSMCGGLQVLSSAPRRERQQVVVHLRCRGRRWALTWGVLRPEDGIAFEIYTIDGGYNSGILPPFLLLPCLLVLLLAPDPRSSCFASSEHLSAASQGARMRFRLRMLTAGRIGSRDCARCQYGGDRHVDYLTSRISVAAAVLSGGYELPDCTEPDHARQL